MDKIVYHGNEWYLLSEKSDDVTLTPLDKERAYPVNKKTENVRTVKQNASLHKYCALASKTLNAGGFTIQGVVALFKKAGISWTMLSVKDVIWRNIQVAIVGKESTTKLNSDEITKVYKHVDFYLTDTVGIESIDFPSIESMIFKENYKG